MRFHSCLLTVVLLLPLAPSLRADPQQSYGLDEDPIRLGEKALRSGDLESAAANFAAAIAADYRVDQALYGLAQLAVQRGRFAEAEPLYRDAIARRVQAGKEYPQARAQLGLLLLRAARDAEAESEFSAALEADDRLWSANYGRALLLLRAARWEDAQKLLEKGEKLKGIEEGEDQYHFGIARYYLGVGKAKEAEEHALLAFHANPADPDYGMLVGEIYQRGNTPALAITAFESALSSPSMAGRAPLLHELGGLYEAERRFDEARERYLAAVRADSLYAPAWKSLAKLYRRGQRPEQAAQSYLRYLGLASADVEAQLGLAEACHELGNHRQAFEAAQAALKLEPDNETARYEFVRSGIYLREPELRAQAADYFAQLAAELEWSVEDYAKLASIEIARKNLPAAQAVLTRGFADFPDALDLHFQQGILALNSKDIDTAIAHLQTVSVGRPELVLAHLNLGIAYLQAQRVPEAIESLQRAVQLDESLTSARLVLAQALASGERLDESEQQYREILQREPESAPALRGLGFCRLRSSDFAAAAKHYRQATEVEPQNAEGWAGLGNASLGLKDLGNAESAFRKASSLDPKHPATIRGLKLLEQYKQGNNQG